MIGLELRSVELKRFFWMLSNFENKRPQWIQGNFFFQTLKKTLSLKYSQPLKVGRKVKISYPPRGNRATVRVGVDRSECFPILGKTILRRGVRGRQHPSADGTARQSSTTIVHLLSTNSKVVCVCVYLHFNNVNKLFSFHFISKVRYRDRLFVFTFWLTFGTAVWNVMSSINMCFECNVVRAFSSEHKHTPSSLENKSLTGFPFRFFSAGDKTFGSVHCFHQGSGKATKLKLYIALTRSF